MHLRSGSRGGSLLHAENSVAAVRAGLLAHPAILEVDVRQSRDGLLYCYHGSLLFMLLYRCFFRFLSFRTLQLFLPHLALLSDITPLFSPSVILDVDLKDHRISALALQHALRGCRSRKIWLATTSLFHLSSLRVTLGDKRFVYRFNRPLLFFSFDLLRARDAGADIVFLWWWHTTPRHLAALTSVGLLYALYPYGLSRKAYLRRVHQINSLFICYRDLARHL